MKPPALPVTIRASRGGFAYSIGLGHMQVSGWTRCRDSIKAMAEAYALRMTGRIARPGRSRVDIQVRQRTG